MTIPATDDEETEKNITAAAAPRAAEVDRLGSFPREAIDRLAAAGYLGLASARDVGGQGMGLRQAAEVVEIAGNRHLTTLAFSEAGSRGHFWVPMSTASASGSAIRLDAQKSWVTSAGEADWYVWSSRPVADGLSSLWLVPAEAPGLSVRGPFDGLGLRGNASSPVTADGVTIPAGYALGRDGQGFDIMMGTVLPWFQVLNAAFSVGTMHAAIGKTAAHLTATRYEHLGQTLADQPTARQAVARMQVRYDQAKGLLAGTIDAIEQGRADAQLRVLEVKASASEAAIEVTDTAMRTCGGAAFRKEVGVERNFRDARAASVMAPSTEVLYDFIGKAVCGMPLF